jgi:hypothetical protein
MHVSCLNLDNIELHQNEPKMRTGTKGLITLPSVGMRHAPEILILELFRDIFFANSPAQAKTRELQPDMRDEDTNAFVFGSIGQRATVAALRNRRKQNRQSRLMTFHAPAYPSLAAHAWLSKKRERVITRLLFEGVFAQHLWAQGEMVERQRKVRDAAIETILTSSLGTPKRTGRESSAQPDILEAAVGNPAQGVDIEASRERLTQLCGPSSTVLDTIDDELAARVFNDVLAICKLETSLPRILWLRVLMTHLRMALPMWLLAQMQISSLVHGWLLEAIDEQRFPTETDIASCLGSRNRGLLRPTLTPTREVFSSIREYIKSRVELNVLLYCLEALAPDQMLNRTITVRRTGSGYIPLAELLQVAASVRGNFRECPEWGGAPSVRVFLRRHCETYRAWRDPINKGQGKNIDEFLRVLYRAERGDEAGGHLLLRQGRGANTGFRVFPGQLLLQTIAALAANAKRNCDDTVAGGGKLVLEDIEEHFAQYGIDFSLAADARPLLMQELQALGLLSGSPDAGSSVAVSCPF